MQLEFSAIPSGTYRANVYGIDETRGSGVLDELSITSLP